MNAESRAEIEAQRISLFFRKPGSGLPNGDRRSNLYTLRRDLCELLSPENSLPVDPKAPMLAAVGMLSGIDLMSWTTTWPNEPERSDFVAFLKKYGSMAEGDAEALYQYRCAQVHSYGLFSIRRQKPARAEYTFTLDQSISAHAVIEHSPDAKHPHNYVVSLVPLRRLFLSVTDKYEEAVTNDQPTRTAFLKAIEKIGFIYIKSDWCI